VIETLLFTRHLKDQQINFDKNFKNNYREGLSVLSLLELVPVLKIRFGSLLELSHRG
jgi:hypothetical protein